MVQVALKVSTAWLCWVCNCSDTTFWAGICLRVLLMAHSSSCTCKTLIYGLSFHSSRKVLPLEWMQTVELHLVLTDADGWCSFSFFFFCSQHMLHHINDCSTYYEHQFMWVLVWTQGEIACQLIEEWSMFQLVRGKGMPLSCSSAFVSTCYVKLSGPPSWARKTSIADLKHPV